MIKNRNFIWNMIGNSLNSFLSLFLLIIVTRINGIELSGMFSYAFTLTLILQMISNYGGRIYQVSDYNEEFKFAEYLGSRVKTSFISIIILLLFCIYNKFDDNFMYISLSLMGLRIIETFSDVIYASFQKNDRLDKIGKSLTMKSLLILLLFYIIEFTTKNIKYSSIMILIASLIIFLCYDIPNIKIYEKLKISYNNQIYDKSKYIFLLGFITLLILNTGRFVAKNNINDIAIGYLGILMMIPTVMSLVSQFIIQPEIINLTNFCNKNQHDQFNHIKNKMIKSLLLFSILCILISITLGPFVLKLLYKLNFNNYRLAFVLLILSGTFNSLTSIYSNILTILRQTKIQFNIYIIVLIINTIFSYILSKFYGLYGIFFALLIAMFIQYILFYLYYLKLKNS